MPLLLLPLLLLAFVFAVTVDAWSPPSTSTTGSGSSRASTFRAGLASLEDASSPSSLSSPSSSPSSPSSLVLLLQTPVSRRQGFQNAVVAATAIATAWPLAASAKEEGPPPTPAEIHEAFGKVRVELEAGGGIFFLKQAVADGDFPAVLEFTKSYDLQLRKIRMGLAQKAAVAYIALVEQDEASAKALKTVCTTTRNAVTFDLIGINRNSRAGQENIDEAAKYVQELQDDVQRFLKLEPAAAAL